MYVAAELADFYRKNFSEPNRHVHAKAWVAQNPDNLAIVLLASLDATLEDVASAPIRLPEMLVLDMMKLGTGAAEGSKLGIAEDVLRILSVTPPGRAVSGAAGVLKPLIGRLVQTIANVLRWRHIKGGRCASITIAQAMQRTGTRLVVPLSDVAKAAGKPLADLSKGLSLDEIRAALTSLRADFKEVPAGFARTWQSLASHAARTEGVVLVGLKAASPKGMVGHTILLGQTAEGVKIFDRYGVFSNLDELSRFYRLTFKVIEEIPVIVIRNWTFDPALSKMLQTLGPLGAIVLRGVALVTLNPSVPVTRLQADFDAFIADRDAGPLPANPSPAAPPSNANILALHYVPAQGAMLSKVSMSYYGTYHMWPLIWDENRELIGPNPNRVPRDIHLRIMKRHVYSAAQLAEAKSRSLNWQSFD